MGEPTEPAAGDTAGVTRETGGDDDSLLKAVLGMTVLEPPITLTTGEVIDGAYRIERRIGSGGMAVVYLARDLRLHRDVAVKLHPAPAGEAGAERLVREAQTMAQLVHPNIATIHEAGTWNGHPFVAIEYVDGGTARTWAEATRRTRREILELYLAAGRGLAAAHKAGVVHRDFKPDNVLVGKDGRIRVADFGIARAYAGPVATDDGQPPTLTSPGAVMGTPAYMAPEQRESATVGPAADQYAFAVSLWEALAGERPGDVSGRSGIARELARPLRRALSADPASRFPSMDGLLAALERGASAPRRRRVALAATALAGLAAGGYLALAGGASPPDPCRGTGDEIDMVWNAERGEAIRSAFALTGRTFADAAAERTADRLDGYAGDWAAERLEACRATHVRGEQAPEQLERRVHCLDRRRDELAALVDVLTRAVAAAVVDRSVDLAYGLRPPQDCADPARLAAEPALPLEQARRVEIEAIEQAITQAGALYAASRFEDGVGIARDAVARADAIGEVRLAAEARVHLGSYQGMTGDAAEARATLETAARQAAEAGDDHLVAQAWLGVLSVLVIRLRDVEQAERFVPVVEAAVAGTSEASRRALDPRAVIGALRLEQGRPADAVVVLEESVASRTDGSLAGDPRLAGVLFRLAAAYEDVGRVDDARAAYARAEALLVAAYGVDHPSVGTGRNNLSLLLMNLGELDAARELLVELIASRERLSGPAHPSLATPLSNLGLVLMHMERGEEARPHLERALTIGTAKHGTEHHDIARDEQRLGELLITLGEHARARKLLEHALAVQEKVQGERSRMAALTLSHLAAIDRHLGDFAAARKRLARARAIATDYPEFADAALFERDWAELLAAEGRTAEAIAAMRRAIELGATVWDAAAPDRADLHLALATLLVEPDPTAARAELDRALAIIDSDAGAEAARDLRRRRIAEQRRRLDGE